MHAGTTGRVGVNRMHTSIFWIEGLVGFAYRTAGWQGRLRLAALRKIVLFSHSLGTASKQ